MSEVIFYLIIMDAIAPYQLLLIVQVILRRLIKYPIDLPRISFLDVICV